MGLAATNTHQVEFLIGNGRLLVHFSEVFSEVVIETVTSSKDKAQLVS